MNRVYKVIWSKAKHCYVVTSEIAKSVTKSASSARSAGRKGAVVLALAALLFTAGGMLGEAANVTDVAAGETANVITVTKDDGNETPITINNVAHANEADYAIKATSDGNGEVIHNIYARKADVEKDYVKKTDAQVTNLTASGDVKANGTLNAVGGVFAGGDTAAAAKAALNADGSIKGANGKFTVDANGKVTANGGVDTNGGEILTRGGIINAGATITGTSLNTQGGAISGGAITGTTITGTSLNTQNGEINGGDIKSSGSLSVTRAMDGNSLTLKGGNLDAGSGTITTTGDIKGNNITAGGTITTKNLAVTGGLEMDHITLGGK